MTVGAVARRRIPAGWLGGLGCGAVLMLDPATVLLLAVLLAPSLLVAVSDDRPGRAGMRAVLLCNAAAAIGPTCHLWQELPPTVAHALALLSGMSAVAVAWLAAGFGWLLSEILVLAARQVLTLRARRERDRLYTEIETLRTEWGEPPMKKAPSKDGAFSPSPI